MELDSSESSLKVCLRTTQQQLIIRALVHMQSGYLTNSICTDRMDIRLGQDWAMTWALTFPTGWPGGRAWRWPGCALAGPSGTTLRCTQQRARVSLGEAVVLYTSHVVWDLL